MVQNKVQRYKDIDTHTHTIFNKGAKTIQSRKLVSFQQMVLELDMQCKKQNNQNLKSILCTIKKN